MAMLNIQMVYVNGACKLINQLIAENQNPVPGGLRCFGGFIKPTVGIEDDNTH